MDRSPPGSSVHRISQARILELPLSPLEGPSDPGIQSGLLCLLHWLADSFPLGHLGCILHKGITFREKNNKHPPRSNNKQKVGLHPEPRPMSPKAHQAFSLKEILTGPGLALSFLIWKKGNKNSIYFTLLTNVKHPKGLAHHKGPMNGSHYQLKINERNMYINHTSV